MLWFRRHRDSEGATRAHLRCSFCNKSETEVCKLIAGPSVYICDECVQVCEDIIADDTRRSGAAEGADNRSTQNAGERPIAPSEKWCALCHMPAPEEEGILIPNRGVLCRGCMGEIEAAISNGREPRS